MVPLTPRQRHASRFQRIRCKFNHVRTALSFSPPSPFNEHEASDDEARFIARSQRLRELGLEELVVQKDDYELKKSGPSIKSIADTLPCVMGRFCRTHMEVSRSTLVRNPARL
ncbi:hypothetical protein JG687_00008211 [Phytophthora cactorum]|uniref:Uncharacterized protein n=1 Tax=Phytophthora cactorum TaxID=29920 RepID=A0A8T1UIA9_9STRA|nr:hypothetical protein JG687_00008211 [Phytophthora cactorum]